jgi:hypothetical protein
MLLCYTLCLLTSELINSYSVAVGDSSLPPLTTSVGYAGTIGAAPTSLTVVCTPTNGPTTAGSAYSATCNAYSGVGPYNWSISGSLPAGLSLSSSTGPTVTISGTPGSVGAYRYSVILTDSSSPPHTASQSYSGTIIAAPSPVPSLTINCTPSTGPTAVGKAYSAKCTASGGTLPYNWSTGGTLPPGLALTVADNAATLSGTPTIAAAGPYSYVVQAIDSSRTPQTASQVYSGTIPGPLTLNCTPTTSLLAAGVAYSATCVAGGGTAPYTASTSGTLPAGLTVSSNGTAVTISGTPTTAGAYSYSITITDSGKPVPQSASQPFSGTISGPAVTTPSLPNATVGTRYSSTLAAGGGTPPYTWSADPKTLPQGLTLDPATGIISGTPALPGTFSISIQVTDKNQASVTTVLSLAVGLPPTPAPDFSTLPATVNPAQQLSWTVTLGAAYPLPITGELAITLNPGTGLPGDPSVLFANGDTKVQFTIDKNSTQATVPVSFQTGTVSGDIVITVQHVTAAGQNLTPDPAGTHSTHVNALAPVIKSVTLTRVTGGFSMAIVGYASSGQVTTGTFQFTPTSGANLQTTQLSVPVQSIFTNWYQSTQASQSGSSFTYTQQFQVQGDVASIASVTVTLENQQGKSPAVTGSF